MKRGFTILFIELFCVQASLFLGALLQEYALFCQIMLLFFLALTYRRIYLLARRSLKNAQEEEKFQALQKQEQLQIDIPVPFRLYIPAVSEENGITIWKTIFFH